MGYSPHVFAFSIFSRGLAAAHNIAVNGSVQDYAKLFSASVCFNLHCCSIGRYFYHKHGPGFTKCFFPRSSSMNYAPKKVVMAVPK